MAHNQIAEDISQDLMTRIDVVQQDLEQIDKERAALEERRKLAEARLQALRTTLEWERVLHGEPPETVTTNGVVRWWAGLEVKEAVVKLLSEHPNWKFVEIRDKLVQDGFDFKDKKPGNAVNMALVSLRKKGNGGGP